MDDLGQPTKPGTNVTGIHVNPHKNRAYYIHIEKIKRKKREYKKIRDKREVQKYVYEQSVCVCAYNLNTHVTLLFVRFKQD